MTIRRDPFDSMDRMFDQMRRSMMGGWDMMPFDARGQYGRMTSDMNLRLEPTDDGYVVMADLPGFEKDEIDVRYEDDVLSIAARHEAETETDTMSSSLSRHVRDEIRVPGTVREDEIRASYRNGVLEVTLPTEEDVVADDEHRIDIE